MSEQKTLYCSDCGNQLNPIQYGKLLQGEMIYCETCGKKFQAKTVKIDSSDSVENQSSLAELGLSLKKTSKKIGEGSKKIWKVTKKFGKNVNKKIKEQKEKKKQEKMNQNQQPYSEEAPQSQPRYTQRTSQNQQTFTQRSQPKNQNREFSSTRKRRKWPSYMNFNAPPPLKKRYSYFRRMNYITSVLTAMHVMFMGIVILMKVIPLLQTQDPDLEAEILRDLIPVAVGVIIFLYDFFWVRKKIEDRDLPNFGLDFILVGILGAVFGWGVGVYLAFKGFIVMVVSATDSTVFAWKYKRTFGDVVLSLTNIFASILGFIILGFTNPYFIELDSIQETYFFIALGCLAADIIFLRLFAKNRKIHEIPLWIGFLKLLFGIIACFHYFSGIILVIQGFFITVVALFKRMD